VRDLPGEGAAAGFCITRLFWGLLTGKDVPRAPTLKNERTLLVCRSRPEPSPNKQSPIQGSTSTPRAGGTESRCCLRRVPSARPETTLWCGRRPRSTPRQARLGAPRLRLRVRPPTARPPPVRAPRRNRVTSDLPRPTLHHSATTCSLARRHESSPSHTLRPCSRPNMPSVCLTARVSEGEMTWARPSFGDERVIRTAGPPL